MNSNLSKKNLNIGRAEFELREGVIYSRILSSKKMTMDDAKASVTAILELSEGRVYPIIADMKFNGINKDAKEYLVQRGRKQLVSAAALITDSAIAYFFGKLFFLLARQYVPIQLFKTEAAARKWLVSLNLKEVYR